MNELDPNIIAAIVGAVFAIERFLRRRATVDAEKIESLEGKLEAYSDITVSLRDRLKKVETEVMAIKVVTAKRGTK